MLNTIISIVIRSVLIVITIFIFLLPILMSRREVASVARIKNICNLDVDYEIDIYVRGVIEDVSHSQSFWRCTTTEAQRRSFGCIGNASVLLDSKPASGLDNIFFESTLALLPDDAVSREIINKAESICGE